MTIKKVLIVDDSETDLLYLSEILEKAGFTVITADSGEASLVKAEAEMPDLVLMDIIMPGMTGFQATRALSKNPKTEHIPVIVCTGKAVTTDRMWALRQGAKECVIKPVDAEELLTKIRALE